MVDELWDKYTIPVYNLDYDKVIDRTQKDLVTYNAKFKLWDELIGCKDRYRQDLMGKLLRDKTIYMYAMYQFKHYWFQDMIASDKFRFKIFCAANQLGKSALLNSQAVYDLTIDHGFGFNRSIISKSLQQAKYQMTRIRNMLRQGKINWTEDKGSTDNIMIISVDKFDQSPNMIHLPKDKRYKYTNMLIVAPCTEGALGYDLHAIDLDEFDFWDIDTKNFFYQIAQPRTYHTGGSISIYSNPNGREGFMYELWNQVIPKIGDDPARYKWHRYNFNYWDKEGANQKEFDELTNGMTRRQIESTLLGEFSTGEGSFFTEEEIKSTQDVTLNERSALDENGRYKQTFWFLDVAASVDASVLGGCYVEPDKDNSLWQHVHIFKIHEYPIGYPLYRVVGGYSDNASTDGWHVEKSVKEYLQEAAGDGANPVFGVDVTGNQGMIPLFQSVGIYPLDITFSGPAKSGYYFKTKYCMEKKLLHRPVNRSFDYQFSVIKSEKAERGYWKFHHDKESDHDDLPDMCVALIWLATGMVSEMGLTVIDGKGNVYAHTDDSTTERLRKETEEIKKNTNPDYIGQTVETMKMYNKHKETENRFLGY